MKQLRETPHGDSGHLHRVLLGTVKLLRDQSLFMMQNHFVIQITL